ncbi:MAG: hypothetical protein WCL39_12125 [Armatimonadota bacterium]
MKTNSRPARSSIGTFAKGENGTKEASMRDSMDKGRPADWFGLCVCFVVGALPGALLGWNVWVGLCGGHIGRRYPLLYLPSNGLDLTSEAGMAIAAGGAAICGTAVAAWYWFRNRRSTK